MAKATDTPRARAFNALRRSIEREFTEALRRSNFEPDGKSGLAYLYRRRGQKHDLVEVQFDKYRRPTFIVNFGQVSADGLVDAYGRYIEAAKVHISHLVHQGRLYACPKVVTFWECWFRAGRLLVRSPEDAAKREIQKLIRLFDQVENWLSTGAVGPNLHIWHWPQNGPGVAKRAMEASGKWPPEGWSDEDERRLRL